MAEILDFDLGKKEYQLGKGENAPVIEIVTSDVNFPIRLSDGIKQIETYITDMQKSYGIIDIKDIDDLSNSTTGDVEKDIELMRKADAYVKEKLNFIFDYDVSSAVFGQVSGFTVDRSTGEYLFEKLINVFVPIINAEYGACVEKMKSRVKAYTDRKGMHPAYKK